MPENEPEEHYPHHQSGERPMQLARKGLGGTYDDRVVGRVRRAWLGVAQSGFQAIKFAASGGGQLHAFGSRPSAKQHSRTKNGPVPAQSLSGP